MNLVPCTACEYQRDSSRQGDKAPCDICNKTRMMIDPNDVLCNMCGERNRPKGHNEAYSFGLENVSVSGGYESTGLLDMHTYTFNVCENCLRVLFNQFKIPPKVKDGFEEIDFKKDQEYYEYHQWKYSLDGEKEAYKAGLCNTMIKACPNKAIYSVYYSGEFSTDCCCEEHKSWYGNTFGIELKPFISDKIRKFQ